VLLPAATSSWLVRIPGLNYTADDGKVTVEQWQGHFRFSTLHWRSIPPEATLRIDLMVDLPADGSES
jgi:hypothetical protein